MQQERVDRNFLASTRIGTPDPRQADPPEGQRLLIAWDLPRSSFVKEPHLDVTVRLWDETQKVFQIPMERKRDTAALFFPHLGKERGLLTYRVEVRSKEGEILDAWVHQLWTELIAINCSDAQSSKDSVSSHPMQGSVTEMP